MRSTTIGALRKFRCEVVMKLSTILMVLAGWYSPVYSQISLPFKDKTVKGLSFDGQPLKMLVDTGISGTYILYKEWYERTFGKGACKRTVWGCYSCPGECNPYSREKGNNNFNDGGSIIHVSHDGVVKIGKYELKMQFRLIIGYSVGTEVPDWKPPNIFGLASATPRRTTVVSQLYKNGIIKRNTISVCSPSYPQKYRGTVILGEWNGLCAIKSNVTTIPMGKSHSEGHLLSDLSSYGLVSSTGQTYTQHRRTTAVYDTGTVGLYIPKFIFEDLLSKIASFAGPDVYLKTRNGYWYITAKRRRYFPTLTFSVGDSQHPLVIRTPPEKYTSDYDKKWYKILIRYYDRPEIILGRSFFTTYFSSYDLDSRTISIAEYASG
ncbi:hypothetical protein FOL47_006155 [Perkinsus chesapeaki]|uniref:Peptidase A1 domain-containing protein n=1 Tax=Perkinsus chesapeaki TaxID=330153 RepID=A0A7J6LTM5_PERCH|nr:hypothetical protein FOL47_006155 [Perkinsus chesapeaki]